MIEPRQQSAVFGTLARELIAHGKGFRFCARGRSMWPTIQDGDILHVEPFTKSPKRGDIVLFFREGKFGAHRIIGGADNNYVTRGDAGMEIDGVVRREEMIGKVVAKECPPTGRLTNLNTGGERASFLGRRLRGYAVQVLRRWQLLACQFALLAALVTQVQLWATQAGVAVDQSAHEQSNLSCAGSCSANFTAPSIAVTSGLSGPILLVGFSMQLNGNSGSAESSVTYNGCALTHDVSGVNGDEYVAIWHLVPTGTCPSPFDGTAHTVNFTVSKQNNSSIGIVVGAVSLFNTSQTIPHTAINCNGGPPTCTGGANTTPSITIPSASCDGVLAVLANKGSIAVTAGVNQNVVWNNASGTGGGTSGSGSSNDSNGFGTLKGGDASITMTETLNSNAAWEFGAVDVGVSATACTTAATTNSFSAARSGSGVIASWRSSAEVNNLGYNVYRDVAGVKTKVNASLISGSALLIRDALPQHGAKSYGWIDAAPVPGAVYWLEDVDLNGTRTMHGPVSVESAAVATQPVVSPAISSFTRMRSQSIGNIVLQPNAGSHVLERTAGAKDMSSSSQKIGFQLAAKSGIKILVDHEGWYRVTQPQLLAAGLRPNANSNSLHLYAEGVEQPIRITGGGAFGPQSAIEFYGTAIDTPYSGQRVYWLAEQGGIGLRIPEISGPGTAVPQSPSFTQTLELKPRTTYFAALLRDNTDNFFGPLVSPTPDVETMNVADLARGEAQITVSLQGVTTGQQHDVTVMLNGSTLGDVTFSDQQEGSAEFAVPAGILLNGANSITLTAQQGSNDLSLVDTITLSFAHTYTAESDLLKFTAGAGQSIAISGFSRPPSRLVDITNPLRPVRVQFSSTAQNGTYTLRSAVPWTTAGEHTLLALSDLQLGSPVNIVPHAPTRLHAPQRGAEFVVITAPQFNAQFQPLAALHEADGGSAAVINVSDIYDEFNFGEPSPFAVKAFLKNATTAWTAKPHYLVLGGDASVDPRNYLGFGFFDFVPTRIVSTSELKTASDDWFSDFNNTGVATIATGRMAARTPSDAQLMVSKTVAYSTGAAGSWNGQALLVADTDDPDISFTQAAQSVQGLLPSSLNATDVFAGTLGTSTANQNIVSGINSGQLLVNYNGHGSVQVWGAGGLFDDTMAASLTNGNKLPFFVIMNCLNGFFQDVYTQSLAESLMLAPNGGAVAVWASSGLTNAEPQFQMNNQLMQALFSQPSPALGDAVLTAKSGISDSDVRRTFIFFGDPAMRLRMPGSTGETLGSSHLRTAISAGEKSER